MPFSEEEIDRLTTLGAISDDVSAEQLEAAWEAKWGLSDIGTVADAINKTAARWPDADGGTSYNPDTLTYTQWVVADVEGGEQLRSAVRKAFESAGSGSNIQLAFGVTTASLIDGEETMASLSRAVKDDSWPTAVPLTGIWQVEHGTFELHAGQHADDEEVVEFFARRWPDVVTVVDGKIAMQAENRRNDSPANGWNGGQAMCVSSSGVCSSTGDRARCTAGFEWRTDDGKRWMTTAGHCLEDHPFTTEWRRFTAPRYIIGHNTAADTKRVWLYDAGLFRQSTYTYDNHFWIGGKYGTGRREITASEPHASQGETIYFSGANSGGQQGVVISVGNGTCDGWPVRWISGLRTTGGDSGAPVAVPNTSSPESGDYRAAGTHSCGAEIDTDGWRGYTQVEHYIAAFGGSPATN